MRRFHGTGCSVLSTAESGERAMLTVLGRPLSLSEHQIHMSNRMGCSLGCIPSKKSPSGSKFLHICLHLLEDA